MDLTRIKHVQEFESPLLTTWDINQKIQEEGWYLIAVRIVRPQPEGDGSYHDILVYTLGREFEDR